MTLLIHQEEITKTMGFLKSFNFDFENNVDRVEIENGLFLLPLNSRTETQYIKSFGVKHRMTNGTFVLHALEKKRPLKNAWEPFDKFYHLGLAIRLLTGKRCDSIFFLHYDDSVTPAKLYEESFLGNSENILVHNNESFLDNGSLIKLRRIFSAIDKNFQDGVDPEKYSRLNNALRIYNIAYSEDWHLMKITLFFVVLESLFSDVNDQSDISYKVRLRSAHLLYPNIEDKEKREKTLEYLKNGYDIRSKFLHGGNVEKEILKKQKKHKIGEYTYLVDYMPVLNETVCSILIKILEDPTSLKFFTANQNDANDKRFFNDLVL